MNTVRVLLLEDDLKTIAVLTHYLDKLEQEISKQGMDLSLVVLSEYSMVEDYINPDNKHKYDIVLLDRDCKMCGSFHTLNFEKFDLNKIISISSIPQWNEEAKQKGVSRVVWKDYENIYYFAEKVIQEIREIMSIPPMSKSATKDEPLSKNIGEQKIIDSTKEVIE